MDNRITRLLGVDDPIVQAPMGWIARAQLAAAASNAGGLGIIADSLAGLSATVAGPGQLTPGTTANR
ncbi:nitronate monooxygenase [Kineobactrum salinum]|uniref:nitronate monooxygenase n=1 Tax=Kineobactrum salinum TaxID=2708301 RepID=UPI002F968DC6